MNMTFKLLINARKSAIIKDIFIHAGTLFSCMSTSDCWEDIVAHIELFKPDVYIFFVDDFSKDFISQMSSIKKNPEYKELPIIIVGSEELCSNIVQTYPDLFDKAIKRPITTERLLAITKTFLENKRLEEEERRAAEEREKAFSEAEQNANRKKHILIIDDDRNMLKLLKTALEEKYEVTVMASGKMARKYLETRTADLILLDYEMPGESGPEVLINIRKDNRLINIPVVFLTGISDKEKIKSVIMLNPQGYLLKPIDMERVFSTIEDIIG